MEFSDYLIQSIIYICIFIIILYAISYIWQIKYEFKIIKNNETFIPHNPNTEFRVSKRYKGKLNRTGNSCENSQQIRKGKNNRKIAEDVISKSIEILNDNIKKISDTESKLIEKFEELENLNKKTLDTICQNNKINRVNANPNEVMINARIGALKNIPNQTVAHQFILDPEANDQYYKYINPLPIAEDKDILGYNYNFNKYFANPLEYVNDELTKSVKETAEVKAVNE